MFSGFISSHVQGLLMHRSKFTCIKLAQSDGKHYITEKQCWLFYWLIFMFVLTAVLAKKMLHLGVPCTSKTSLCKNLYAKVYFHETTAIVGIN